MRINHSRCLSDPDLQHAADPLENIQRAAKERTLLEVQLGKGAFQGLNIGIGPPLVPLSRS